MDKDNGDSWITWRRAILQELERHNKILEKLTDDSISVKGNLIALKIYATIAGGLGGIITTLILHKLIVG